jgi:hypothetical protein
MRVSLYFLDNVPTYMSMDSIRELSIGDDVRRIKTVSRCKSE